MREEFISMNAQEKIKKCILMQLKCKDEADLFGQDDLSELSMEDVASPEKQVKQGIISPIFEEIKVKEVIYLLLRKSPPRPFLAAV